MTAGSARRVGLPVGVIAGAHQRAAGGMREAHLPRLRGSSASNAAGVDVAQHRQVAGARLQVLADRQHVDVVRAQVAHHLEDFVVGLAQAQHQAGLGRAPRDGALELAAAACSEWRVVGARARLAVQARHGFEVVVHHVRRRRPPACRARRPAGRGNPASGSRCACRATAARTAGCSRRSARRRRRAGRRDRRW